jgi:hypothetical protein
MKRLFIIAIIASIFSGCAELPVSLPFLGTPTPTDSPQPTATPFSLQASNTPDLFVINTAPPTATPPIGVPLIGNTPIPSLTPTRRPTITLEPIDPNLFTPSANLFLAPQLSTYQLVWGYNCDGARSIKFVVQVNVVRRLKYVLLFIRLQDKYSARVTDWGAGAIMKDNDKGTYFYTVELDQIENYRDFEDAWLQYQFVASTSALKVLGRSIVSRNEVSLTNCRVFNR